VRGTSAKPVIARSAKVNTILSINKAVLTWFAGNLEWEYAEPPSPAPWTPRNRSADSHAALPRNPEQSQQDEERRDDTYYAEPPLGEASDISKGIEGLTLEPTPRTPRDVSTAETAELPSVSEDYHRYAEPQHYPEDRHGPEDQQYPEDLQEPEERQYGDGQQFTVNQFYRKDTREFRSRKGKSRGDEEILCPTCSMTFHLASDLERHHKTVHLKEGADGADGVDGARPYQCLVDGCTANVRSWTTADKLRLHGKIWHGGDSGTERSHTQEPFTSSQPVFDVPQVSLSGYDSSYLEQPTTYDPQSVPSPQSSLQTRKVYTKNPQGKNDELDPSKSCDYVRFSCTNGSVGFKVHKSSEFRFGRVFKVLWSEPKGSGGTEINVPAKYGQHAIHKIRRFIIVKSIRGHSVCIPILTYGYRGVLKHGVHPEDHAVVFSSKKEGFFIHEGEEGLMSKKPIRIEIKDASHKLDPSSRLNYAKVYTVEHNVRVLFIGRVAENYEQEVVKAFNDTHPPLGPSPHDYRPDSPVFSHAEGPTPDYPASSASYSSGAQQYPSFYATANSYPYFGPGAESYNHAEGPTPDYQTPDYPTSSASYSSGAQQYPSSYATANSYPYPGSGAESYNLPDAYRPQPRMPHARQQQQSENQRYDDGYDAN
jgi:hypothetical protein